MFLLGCIKTLTIHKFFNDCLEFLQGEKLNEKATRHASQTFLAMQFGIGSVFILKCSNSLSQTDLKDEP